MRTIWIWVVILCLAAGAYCYFDDPTAPTKVSNGMHAAWYSLVPDSDEQKPLKEKVISEYTDRERQSMGYTAYGHKPGGFMTRTVFLPSGYPNGRATAEQICEGLMAGGFVGNVETKFPSISRTDTHELSLKIDDLSRGPSTFGITVLFTYSGYVKQGDPRKIADYGEQLVRTAVAEKYPTFHPSSRPTLDVSETAIITDLPGEPQTAAAQARLFPANPTQITASSSVAATTPASPAEINPAPASQSQSTASAPDDPLATVETPPVKDTSPRAQLPQVHQDALRPLTTTNTVDNLSPATLPASSPPPPDTSPAAKPAASNTSNMQNLPLDR